MSLNLGSMYVILEAKTATFQKDMADAEKIIVKFGDSTRAAGRFISRWISAPLIVAGGFALKAARDFQYAMEQVNTVMQMGEEDQSRFKEATLRLSDTYGKSATDIMEANYKITSVWQTNARDTLKFVEHVTKMAVAGKMSVKAGSDAIVNVMATYGMSIDKVIYATNVLAQAVKLGNAEMRDMAIQLPRVSGIAKPLGVSFYELASAYAYMSGRAGTTQQGGTALLNLFGAMLNNTVEMKAAVMAIAEKWGLHNVVTARGLILSRGLVETFKAMGEYIGNDTDKLTRMIPTLRGLAGSTQLLRGIKEYEEMAKGMVGWTGEVNRQMEAQAGWAFKLGLAWERIHNAGIRMVEVLVPGMVRIADAAGRVALLYSQLSDSMKTIVAWALVAAAVLGPLTFFGGAFIAAFGSAALVLGKLSVWLYKVGQYAYVFFTMFRAWTLTFATLGSFLINGLMPVLLPIALVTAAVVGIGVAFIKITGHGKTFAEKTADTMKWLGNMVMGLPKLIAEAIGATFGFLYNFQDNIGRIYTWIYNEWGNLWVDIGMLVVRGGENIIANLMTLGGKIMVLSSLIGTWVGNRFVGAFKKVFTFLFDTNIMMWFWNKGMEIGNKLWDGFMKGLEGQTARDNPITKAANLVIDQYEALKDAFSGEESFTEMLKSVNWKEGFVSLTDGLKRTSAELKLNLDNPISDWIEKMSAFKLSWDKTTAATEETRDGIDSVGEAMDNLWRGSAAALRGTVEAESMIAQYMGDRKIAKNVVIAAKVATSPAAQLGESSIPGIIAQIMPLISGDTPGLIKTVIQKLGEISGKLGGSEGA